MLLGEDIRNFVQAHFNIRSTLFRRHQKRELQRYQKFFDTVECQPLTDLQRRSVILDEQRTLVVAGAGTGKTSVIVAKAGYLIESGKCRPEDILLLAFNADAAKELAARCKERLGVEVQASTFHALGNQIVGAVEPAVPTLSRLATDRHYFSRFLDRVIEELKADKEAWNRTRRFIIDHLKPYRSESEFSTLTEYVSFIRNVELRALSGDLVKSFAELDIANFLFINGVNFAYESRYPHEAKRYQPDFYLPDHDLWLEHFGIDRQGNTAPYIDRDRYQREMEWKRSTHAKYGTTLLETFSWQKSEGILTKQLDELLKNKGVTYAPRSQEEIFKALKEAGYTSQLAVLVETFLTHFKSNQMSLEELTRKGKNASDAARAKAFIELFRFFLEKYQSELDGKSPREIDFNDMISSATRYVETGRFVVPWKYIIVDEFQDISVGRYRLLEAMLKGPESPKPLLTRFKRLKARRERIAPIKFFAVGDDWQSIYRFAGSDISIMSDFRAFFGRSTVAKLDRTFRFNDRIATVSGAFIQKNPQQIRKSLSTLTQCASPQVFLHWVEAPAGIGRADNAALEAAVKRLTRDIQKDEPSLLILARYTHLLPDQATLNALARIWPGQIKKPLTVHRAKGLEADYVIVAGLTANRYGFPSEIENDPLLDLVLAKPDSYAHAEERRLFYVALTRARHQVHLLVDRTRPSTFALELLNENYDIETVGRGVDDKNVCPECRSGMIEEKRPGFAACSNYPFCTFVAPKCSECGKGFMLPVRDDPENLYHCTDEHCHGTAPRCPKCGTGALVWKTSKYGDMVACHMWPLCDFIKNSTQRQKVRG
jgi:DNA helicase-4